MSSSISKCSLGNTSMFYDESMTKSLEYKYCQTKHCFKIESSRFFMYSSSSENQKLMKSYKKVNALPDDTGFYWERSPTPILDMVDTPVHLKNLSAKELKLLADELRSEIAFLVSKMGIPFKTSLTAVELTVAIHRVFHAPADKILWDVGEQTYAHKILTGRRSLMHTLKQKNGISGFTSRFESEYDAFASGHGCNSVSAGLGMAVARDLKGKKDRVVTVISNWSTMSGQVYEAMSNAGYLDCNMIVILNDSRHSLRSKPEEDQKMTVSALSSTLSKIQSCKPFRRFREAVKGVTKRIGKGMHEIAAKVDQYARGMVGPLGSTLFEELGLYYIGPVDGHNIDDLICVLSQVASMDSTGPVLIHVITEEGKESDYNLKSKLPFKQEGILRAGLTTSSSNYVASDSLRTWDDSFIEALCAEAEMDKDIVAVYAGMNMHRSLQNFQLRFPDRCFDVGLAEQHAVTFSAGMSCGGLKPFCIIPSSYLQSAYDQIIQDIDLQKVPVRFAITSAGLAGSDGPTQSGPFDITFMSCLPNMVVMAPSNEEDLINMVATAAWIDDRPVCIRYPRGVIYDIQAPMRNGEPFEVGKGEILVEGNDVALLGYGSMVQNCLKAHSLLSKLGIHVTVANARFCKPLDFQLIRELCKEHQYLITVEEGTVGGFGSHVSQFLSLDGLLDGKIKWRPIVLPDNYIEHASLKEQEEMAGISSNHIAATTLTLLGRDREALILIP